MDFISNKDSQIKTMLAELGLSSVDDLFSQIPADLKTSRPILDDGLSEFEGLCLMENLAAKNTFTTYQNYMGAGAYEHHVPAIIGAICSKSEFLTSYTPYQAEASQGMLQAIFEFQSVICALTGMDAANASVYDGASACAEAILMSLRLRNGKNKVLIAETVHPHYRAVITQYLKCHPIEICLIPVTATGKIDKEKFDLLLDEQVAAVLIQSPNYWGVMEECQTLFASAKEKQALSIICANPLAYGLFRSAAEQEADIAVGDCQPLGIALQFGGPYAGYMACKQEYVRQLPGRIVGETLDSEGTRGFILTLQAREQHIRREKATSNICTNQALSALASLVGTLWYGKKGLKELALTNFQRAAYLKQALMQIKGVKIISDEECFNEFVIQFDKPLTKVMVHFQSLGIQPGVELEKHFPLLKSCLLVAVTETKSKAELDHYIQAVKTIE